MAGNAAPPGLQLSWLDDEVVAWQPGRGVYGGNLHHEVARLARRPAWGSTASPRVVPLVVPEGQINVMCQRIDAATLTSLGGLGALGSDASASVAWFGAMHRYADDLVSRGRVLPSVRRVVDNQWVAEWHPLVGDLAAGAPVFAAMPPVVAAAGPVDPEHVLRTMVDRLARFTLIGRGWGPTLSDTRTVHARAVRLVSRALSSVDNRFSISPELTESVSHISLELAAMLRRADGQPILRGRLRLGLPDPGAAEHFDLDPADDAPVGGWPLTYELVDVDDRSRWCTGADIRQRTPVAASLAREPRFAGTLAQQSATDLAAIADAVPELADWVAAQPSTVPLESAAATLEAIDLLAAAGVELVAPEKLVRRKPSTRAAVQSPDIPGTGRLAATALVQWKVVVDDTPVDPDVLARAAADGATLIEVGGRWVQLDRAEARRALANLAEHRDQHGELSALQLLELAAELERELEAAGVDPAGESSNGANDLIQATGWAADLLAGLPDAGIAEGVVPPEFTATLRPYQRRGLGWLQFLRSLGLGGCLADDMGLGKTPTTLAHLAGVPGPHLVVCPLSVVRNWEAEASRFVPLMRVMVHHGTGRYDHAAFVQAVASHDLVITTYQVGAKDLEALQAVPWSTLVLDEAQAVKNPDTRTARAMRAVPAQQRIALTGTPVENRLSELWSIFHVVTPGLLGNAAQFRARYAIPIEKQRDAAATAALRTLTAPFLLRRTKADKSLVPDLPDKVEQVAWAPLTREQAHMYQAVVDSLLEDAQQATGMKRRGLVLAALTRLKQICNHPAHALGDGSKLAGRSGKLHRFDELVTDLLDAGEQALVFTQFREMGMLLQQHLHERFGQQVPFLHGGVQRHARDRMVEAFQAGTATSPLLLVSLRAGGTGLNLTAASQVVHYDRWWNPAVEDQATDRAWRIGQSRTVFVHKLVCEGTVEERIDALIDDKRKLADAVVGAGGEAWLSELSTDQLHDLVVLDHSRVRGV